MGGGGGGAATLISQQGHVSVYTHFFLSRWVKKLKLGTLEKLEDIQESEEDVSEDETDDGQYHDDIARESSELIKAMNVDEWVAVFYEANWYPGIVQNVISSTFLYVSEPATSMLETNCHTYSHIYITI